MPDATILLISDDSVLTEQVRGISAAIPGLALAAPGGLDAAFHYGGWDQVSVVLIHQTDRAASMRVSRLLRLIAAVRRPVATIVVAEPYDADQALAFLRMGVADYLDLPLDLTRLIYLIDVLTIGSRKAARARCEQEIGTGASAGAADSALSAAVPTAVRSGRSDSAILDGDTPAVVELVEQVRRVAPQSATVLLGGEIGTGKTHLARQIHDLSDRRDEPFLVVDCGALSGSLCEGDLFGHVRGAFEGASTDRSGKFADVGRGTLFLDGVDALPLAIQTKLLRVVEDRKFEPIGTNRPQPLLARLIAASNRPLEEEVAERRFRSDLYYRLNVVAFQLPPLRERRDAIAPLANRFLNEFAGGEGRALHWISDDAMQALQEHNWPGNVRELRNVVERCVATCPDRSIRREDLPISVLDGVSKFLPTPTKLDPILAATFHLSALAQTKGQAELARITEALEKHNNNRLRAASELGISRMTLYKRLYKYGLMQPNEPR